VDISNAEGSPGSFFKPQPNESIWDALRRQAPDWFGTDGQNPFHKTALRPGQFYPRMARPVEYPGVDFIHSPSAQRDAHSIAVSRGQLIAFVRQLHRICQTIHPTEATLTAYGHDIRNLLILACTEVETHWRGVLVANGVAEKHFNTNDYIKLRAAMRLDEYAVEFFNYPWLDVFRPFSGWTTATAPTRGLEWYDAYNAVKHRRETDFRRATLQHAFEAVSACAVMMVAQFGTDTVLDRSADLHAFLYVTSFPNWPVSELYVRPLAELNPSWEPANFPFDIGAPAA
jgi:hypothetical protein